MTRGGFNTRVCLLAAISAAAAAPAIDGANVDPSALDTESVAVICPGLRQKALCCQESFLGFLHTGCAQPFPRPETAAGFVKGCETSGLSAQCCTINLLGGSVLCRTPPTLKIDSPGDDLWVDGSQDDIIVEVVKRDGEYPKYNGPWPTVPIASPSTPAYGDRTASPEYPPPPPKDPYRQPPPHDDPYPRPPKDPYPKPPKKHPYPDHPQDPYPEHPKRPYPEHPKDPYYPKPPKDDYPKHPKDDYKHPKYDYPKHPKDDYKHPKYDYPKHPKDDYKHPKYDYPKHPKDDYKHPKYDYPKHPKDGYGHGGHGYGKPKTVTVTATVTKDAKKPGPTSWCDPADPKCKPYCNPWDKDCTDDGLCDDWDEECKKGKKHYHTREEHKHEPKPEHKPEPKPKNGNDKDQYKNKDSDKGVRQAG